VAALANSKAVHVSLVVLVIPLGMWAGKDNLAGVMLLPRVAFWLGGVAEVGHAGGTAAEIAKGVAEVQKSLFSLFPSNEIVSLPKKGKAWDQ
jgi:hypothetical protein